MHAENAIFDMVCIVAYLPETQKFQRLVEDSANVRVARNFEWRGAQLRMAATY